MRENKEKTKHSDDKPKTAAVLCRGEHNQAHTSSLKMTFCLFGLIMCPPLRMAYTVAKAQD